MKLNPELIFNFLILNEYCSDGDRGSLVPYNWETKDNLEIVDEIQKEECLNCDGDGLCEIVGVGRNDEIKSAMVEMTGENIEIRQKNLTVDLVNRAIKVEEEIDRMFDKEGSLNEQKGENLDVDWIVERCVGGITD